MKGFIRVWPSLLLCLMGIIFWIMKSDVRLDLKYMSLENLIQMHSLIYKEKRGLIVFVWSFFFWILGFDVMYV